MIPSEILKQYIQEPLPDEQPNEEDDVLASVTYSLRNNGSIGVGCSWSMGNITIASFLAQLLWSINNGRVEELTLGTLVEFGAAKMEYADFIDLVLERYIATDRVVKERPIVSPREVFNLGRLVRGQGE